MRFLSQDLRSGEVRTTEGPTPEPPRNGLLVRTSATLVSAGTERMLVDFGRANLLAKARQQPDRAREVVGRARAEGVVETIDAVRGKLGQPLLLGYANAGVVEAVGEAVQGFRPGDLVASNGPHAEHVAVPVTLAARVPEGVTPAEACFASVAAVGLEAIRLAKAELGEQFVVIGLGLVGLLTVQLLQAQGCLVLGVDPDPTRRGLAASFGATVALPGAAAIESANELSRGRGVDGVLVCASTKSSDPMLDAAHMCRERGRIVLVGATGLDLERTPLYEKELSVQVSRAYGPGRYDPAYEAGADYPYGLVRWTAGRNMEAVLLQVARGALVTEPLVTHRIGFDDASHAYDVLATDGAALGIVLTYAPSDAAALPAPAPVPPPVAPRTRATPGRTALVGAGNFAARVLAPAIVAHGDLHLIASRKGSDAALLATRTGAEATTDIAAVLDDPSVGAVFLATRHDSHASLAAAALRAGKAVYVEKPLALSLLELDELRACVAELLPAPPVLAVGFNRRFAPVTVRMKELLVGATAPKAIVITVNAGVVPAGHWVHDPAIGGGRILGEGCHFVDLSRHLVGSPIADVETRLLGRTATPDSATIHLSFEDGSTSTIHYLANGSPRFPKERVEVFTQGRVLRNHNFRRLEAFGWGRRAGLRLRRQDKGHGAAVGAFLAAAAGGGPPPITLAELFEVSRASIQAAAGAR